MLFKLMIAVLSIFVVTDSGYAYEDVEYTQNKIMDLKRLEDAGETNIRPLKDESTPQ